LGREVGRLLYQVTIPLGLYVIPSVGRMVVDFGIIFCGERAIGD